MHPYALHEAGLSKAFTVLWDAIPANAECAPFKIGVHSIVSIHIFGTFSTGLCSILAGNSGAGTANAPVSDLLGTGIEVFAPCFISRTIDAEWIVPYVSGDRQTSVCVALRGRK